MTGHLVIKRLGGTVPVVTEPAAGARKAQRWRQKVRTAYFAELKGLVGPPTGRFVEREVLERG